MAPDHPPFPAPRNFPFQRSDGIQTSILMSESAVGLSSAATRQKAGKRLKAACCAGGAEGNVNAPASTDSARVMVVFGSASVERLSQVLANITGAVVTARRAMTRVMKYSSRPVYHRLQYGSEKSCLNRAGNS